MMQAIDNNCSICLDTLVLPVSISCGHNFCYLCLRKEIEFCPLCRISIVPMEHRSPNILLGEYIRTSQPNILEYDEKVAFANTTIQKTKKLNNYRRSKAFKELVKEICTVVGIPGSHGGDYETTILAESLQTYTLKQINYGLWYAVCKKKIFGYKDKLILGGYQHSIFSIDREILPHQALYLLAMDEEVTEMYTLAVNISVDFVKYNEKLAIHLNPHTEDELLEELNDGELPFQSHKNL